MFMKEYGKKKMTLSLLPSSLLPVYSYMTWGGDV